MAVPLLLAPRQVKAAPLPAAVDMSLEEPLDEARADGHVEEVPGGEAGGNRL